MNGIDVSHWQGDINWPAVKASGVNFAIIKAGGSDAGFYQDSKFEKNYEGAKASGINVGSYYYVGSKCISYADGVADAKRFIKMLSGKAFEYPVFIDLESTTIADKNGATEACIGFCKTMEEAGYYCGIYASDIYGFKDRLDISKLGEYSKWVARYGSKPSYVENWDMWQSSDSGRINGISGNVDTDESVVDFPSLIKNAGLNGFAKPETAVESDPTDWESACKTALNKLNSIQDILNS